MRRKEGEEEFLKKINERFLKNDKPARKDMKETQPSWGVKRELLVEFLPFQSLESADFKTVNWCLAI